MVKPIVIIGGFLSCPAAYRGMRETLVRLSGQPVCVVETFSHDWLFAVAPIGWKRLLDRLQRTALQALSHASTGKVTLVGHSSGGVVGRLYLSPVPFLGVAYRGLEHVDHLITLGSPHHNERGTRMREWVDETYPGAFFTPQVDYTSVAGRAVQGNRHGSFRERCAHLFYRRLCGDGNAWGDGLVPEESALLQSSRQISLDGVSHFADIVGLWYGADGVISRWWSADDRTPSEPTGFKKSAGPDTGEGAGVVRGGSLD
jgi:pimeloyl-ACP methyl ester carboxylesterase